MAAAGYTVRTERLADYESMFWVGFGLYAGLWLATMYTKFVRAGSTSRLANQKFDMGFGGVLALGRGEGAVGSSLDWALIK